MKDELNKTIRRMCDEVGSAAAAQKYDELSEELDREFDKRVEAGMAELDAYRDVLRNIDQMREMLEKLPKTEKEKKADEEKKQPPAARELKGIFSKVSTCLWLCTVAAVTIASFSGLGFWKYAWLGYLWAAMGQTILNTVQRINAGKDRSRQIKSAATTVFWLFIVIVFVLLLWSPVKWYLSWLVFLLGPILNAVIGLFWHGRK